ncbi:MAG TPA: hypothetical protein VLI06_15235 [Solimonas sp.]|nr:hypothetical protein [Solimonas sp.]
MRLSMLDQPPSPMLRLLANWGLSLSGSACLVPTEEEARCPLRPLLEAVQRKPAAAAAARRHDRR